MSSVHLPSKFVLSSAVLAVALSATTSAFADIAPEGTLHIGAERLFGIVRTDSDTEGFDSDSTSIGFMWGGYPYERPYDRPRAAVDYFIIDSLSLGGSLGFYTWSDDDDDGNDDDGGGFLLHPRVGYMIDISDRLGFWPRGGITYVRDGVDGGTKHRALALSAEAPLVIMLTREVAISIALTIDLGLDGEIDRNNAPDLDHEDNQIGIQVNLDAFL